MNYLELFKRVSEIKGAVKKAHQLALSNRLADDDANKLFEKFDKKAFSFEKAVVEVFGMKGGEYEYRKPGLANPNEKVNDNYVLSMLNASKHTLESLQDGLKATKYKVVDKSKNEVKNLSNGVKSLLTKAVKDMNSLVDHYSPEAEEEAE